MPEQLLDTQLDSQQQQEQQPYQFPPSSGELQPAPPDQDFFRFRIDGTDILEMLQQQLRGEVEINGKVTQMFDRWVNDEGISKILHIVYSCGINKNVFLGNLTKDQINLKCMYLKVKLARLLFNKWQDYEIKKEMRSLVIETVKNQIHSGLSRCEAGLEARQISTASQRHEIYHEGQEKKSGGIFNSGGLFGFRR